MNLPNKISLVRIIFAIVIIILLTFPFHYVGLKFPVFTKDFVQLDLRYIISGVLFVLACITDFIDGKIARKKHLVTDLGVVIIVRDIVVDAIRMMAANKGKVIAAGISGKIKSVFMMIGLSMTFFKNLPFELMGLRVSNFIIIFATILSVYSMFKYYSLNKKLIFSRNIENEVISD